MSQYVQDQYGNVFMQSPDGRLIPVDPRQLQSSMMPQGAPMSVPTPQQAANPLQEAGQSFMGGLKDVGEDQLKEALGIAGAAEAMTPAAGGLAATPAANAAYNATAMGGEVLPEVALEGGGMFDLAGFGGAGNVLLPAIGALGATNLAMSQGDAASGGKRNIRGFGQGAASGAAMGSYFGPWGAAIGGGIGGIAGLAGSLFGSSKGERQQTRDGWRKAVLENAIPLFDSNYQGDLADGTQFDWGKDKFGFSTKEGDIDLSKPAVGKAAAYGNVLAALQGYGGGKKGESIATQFAAASTANLKDKNDLKTVKDNYKHFLGKLGINDAETAYQALYNVAPQIGQKNWDVFVKDMDELFSNSYPTGFDKNGKWIDTSNATPRPVFEKK
jgi:hypothetical protein